MTRLASLLTLTVLVAPLTACGTMPHTAVAARAKQAVVRVADESDHAQMNAIVKSVLDTQFALLAPQADGDHDGALSTKEYAAGHAAGTTKLFFASFDGNADGKVTEAEYTAGLAKAETTESYHHFTEEAMEAGIKPFMTAKNFGAAELRTYMTRSLGLTADWPQLFALMDKLDLNQDGQLLNFKGEGPAFMLTFARPQLQRVLGLPVSSVGD